jgi:hypothetical protein
VGLVVTHFVVKAAISVRLGPVTATIAVEGGGVPDPDGQVVPVGITVDAVKGIPKHVVVLAVTPSTVAVTDT